MPQRVLIAGGTGHIGRAVVHDLWLHTRAHLLITGRNRQLGTKLAAADADRMQFVPLDLDNVSAHQLNQLVRGLDLVVECVGPYRARAPRLLAACLAMGVNYVDLCDDLGGTRLRLGYHATARAAGVTALIATGTFPGIDNVLVADALRRHPLADDVRLHFFCAGSGGGGFGVLQTTFLAVSRPYRQLEDGEWRLTPSYRGRQQVDFGPPFGQRPVHNFEVPELWSLPHTFPQLRTCTSKFGTAPDLWNWATFALASAPPSIRLDRAFLDRSAEFMVPYIHRVDRWVGEALGIRIDVRGPDGNGEIIEYYAPSTSQAVGWATGLAAAMVLDGQIAKSGVLLPETHIPPGPYLDHLLRRGGTLRRRPI